MDQRLARPDDHPRLLECIRSWWGDSRTPEQARQLSTLLPRLFLQHFARTSLVVEEHGEVCAFLVGFHSADRPDEAYIHFVGVDPRLRRRGIAGDLYRSFIDVAAGEGRTTVRAITSPPNRGSIAFHRRMGFTVDPSDVVVDGVPVHPDHDGPGEDRVCFTLTRGRVSA